MDGLELYVFKKLLELCYLISAKDYILMYVT